MAATIQQLIKRPGEERLYSFDFQYFPEIIAGDTLSSVDADPTVTVTPTGLTIGAIAISGDTVTVVLSGGDNEATYDLLCTCRTLADRILQSAGRLLVSTTALLESES